MIAVAGCCADKLPEWQIFLVSKETEFRIPLSVMQTRLMMLDF